MNLRIGCAKAADNIRKDLIAAAAGIWSCLVLLWSHVGQFLARRPPTEVQLCQMRLSIFNMQMQQNQRIEKQRCAATPAKPKKNQA